MLENKKEYNYGSIRKIRKEGIYMVKIEDTKKKSTKIPSKEEKKVINMKQANNEKRRSNVSYILLWILFVLLFGLVVGLSVLVYQKKEKTRDQEVANISIPISKVDSHFSFNINALNLSTSNDEYVFRVSNYKNDTVADKDLTYNITIQNPTDVVIKLTKGDSDKDLMVEQASTVLGLQNFSSQEKEDVYYHIFCSYIPLSSRNTYRGIISKIFKSYNRD